MQKNRKKICIYQKKAVSLHRVLKEIPKQHQIINTKKLPNYDNESKQAKRNCKNY